MLEVLYNQKTFRWLEKRKKIFFPSWLLMLKALYIRKLKNSMWLVLLNLKVEKLRLGHWTVCARLHSTRVFSTWMVSQSWPYCKKLAISNYVVAKTPTWEPVGIGASSTSILYLQQHLLCVHQEGCGLLNLGSLTSEPNIVKEPRKFHRPSIWAPRCAHYSELKALESQQMLKALLCCTLICTETRPA